MPIREYLCKNCGWELVCEQSVTEDALRACLRCQELALEPQLFATPGYVR